MKGFFCFYIFLILLGRLAAAAQDFQTGCSPDEVDVRGAKTSEMFAAQPKIVRRGRTSCWPCCPLGRSSHSKTTNPKLNNRIKELSRQRDHKQGPGPSRPLPVPLADHDKSKQDRTDDAEHIAAAQYAREGPSHEDYQNQPPARIPSHSQDNKG